MQSCCMGLWLTRWMKTSEYCNEDWEQVIVAMKVKQESRASKPNVNTKNCYRGSSTQLYFPAFPRRIANHFHYHKDITNTPEYPTPQSQVQAILLVVKRPQTLFCKTLFPYKNPCRTMSRNEALVCKWRKKKKSESFENTSENEREFQHKNQETKLFWILKTFETFVNFSCYEPLPNHPYL